MTIISNSASVQKNIMKAGVMQCNTTFCRFYSKLPVVWDPVHRDLPDTSGCVEPCSSGPSRYFRLCGTFASHLFRLCGNFFPTLPVVWYLGAEKTTAQLALLRRFGNQDYRTTGNNGRRSRILRNLPKILGSAVPAFRGTSKGFR